MHPKDRADAPDLVRRRSIRSAPLLRHLRRALVVIADQAGSASLVRKHIAVRMKVGCGLNWGFAATAFGGSLVEFVEAAIIIGKSVV